MRLHTPKLLERYDEMVLLKKLKAITKDEFKSEVAKLYDAQKKIDLRNNVNENVLLNMLRKKLLLKRKKQRQKKSRNQKIKLLKTK